MVFNIKLNAEKKYEFNASNNEIDKILNDVSSRGCLMILLNKFLIMIEDNVEQFRNVLNFYEFCGKLVDKKVKYRIVNTEFESYYIEATVNEFINFWS